MPQRQLGTHEPSRRADPVGQGAKRASRAAPSGSGAPRPRGSPAGRSGPGRWVCETMSPSATPPPTSRPRSTASAAAHLTRPSSSSPRRSSARARHRSPSGLARRRSWGCRGRPCAASARRATSPRLACDGNHVPDVFDTIIAPTFQASAIHGVHVAVHCGLSAAVDTWIYQYTYFGYYTSHLDSVIEGLVSLKFAPYTSRLAAANCFAGIHLRAPHKRENHTYGDSRTRGHHTWLSIDQPRTCEVEHKTADARWTTSWP